MKKFPIRIDKSEIEVFCKKHHINHLALFGSILTSRFSKTSDVDVLVRFERKHTPHLFGIAGMEEELSEIIGRQVDLRTPNDLSPYFRRDVLAHAETIYGE
jgi:hypothetical protein